MDHHGLVKRVKAEYEQAIQDAPVTYRVLRLNLSGGDVDVAFAVVDMELLDKALRKIHTRRGIKPTIEMQKALKPLCLELRRQCGRTSTMEWVMLERLGVEVEVEKSKQYPVYLLVVDYVWEIRPSIHPDAPYGLYVPRFDLESEIGVIDTGKFFK